MRFSQLDRDFEGFDGMSFDSHSQGASPAAAVGQLAMMLTAVGGVFGLAYLYNAEKRNPTAPRVLPFNQLHVEMGGDPKELPADKSADTAYGKGRSYK